MAYITSGTYIVGYKLFPIREIPDDVSRIEAGNNMKELLSERNMREAELNNYAER